MPKTVSEALKLDEENGNSLWYDAIQKELKNIQVAFKFLEHGDPIPIGHKEIPCHIIFYIKMDFTRKARFVAGGHKTDLPTSLTYSSVVSRDSVWIGFLIAALNGLDNLAVDIGNAYINADIREKVYFIAGDEFGAAHKGKPVVIVKALYI
jgi:diadenosine tetraphosphatase ApaH/serine/threonine PP2A family protein phosphatase